MSNQFMIKMPCFTLPNDAVDGLGGKRALLLFARVVNIFTCEAVLFLEDGKAVVCNLSRSLVEKVSKQGPFAFLSEVKSLDREPMSILGVNGAPIEK